MSQPERQELLTMQANAVDRATDALEAARSHPTPSLEALLADAQVRLLTVIVLKDMRELAIEEKAAG